VNQQALKTKLSRAADQCVKCGLCLPHCPTYRLRQNEAESPRGRIALIQGLAEGQLADTPQLRAHLASCLQCRACEVACPSLVAFGTLMDNAHALENQSASRASRIAKRLLLDALSSRLGTRGASLAAVVYRKSGLAHLAERTRLARLPGLSAYHRLALQLHRAPRIGETPGSAATPRGELELFAGCVARSSQPGALVAARRVLERLGWRVRISRRQVCCGAMHRHNGFPERADQLLQRAAFSAQGRTLVGIASACVAELGTHPRLEGAREICRFLTDLDWPADVRLRPLTERIAVHEPCSHRNQLRDTDAIYRLLRRIPGVDAVALADNAFCCGAAGTYLLQQPVMSQALLTPKLADLKAVKARILVTTNTGCALHLAAGARESGLALEVLHPVELIARQLVD
jgi:glycolate oxidase iron-sulfur subunit